MNNMDYWNNFFTTSEREHDIENKRKIENLIKNMYSNSFSEEDTLNLQGYVARDFNFFGIKSDHDFEKFFSELLSGKIILTNLQRAKILAYLNNDLNEINIRLNNNPAMDKEGYREEMKSEIEESAKKTEKPEHRLEPDISLNRLKVENDMKREEAKRLFNDIIGLEKELKESPNDRNLLFLLNMKNDELKRAIEKGRIDKEYYETLLPEDDKKVTQVNLPDEVFDRLDEIIQDEKQDYSQLEDFVNNLDIPGYLTDTPEARAEFEKNRKEILDYITKKTYGISHNEKDEATIKEEKQKEKEAFNNIDSGIIKDESVKEERDAKHQERLESFYNEYDAKYYQKPLSHNENADIDDQKETMFNNIDAITGANELPETEKPTIIEEGPEEVVKEASVVFDEPIRLHTISDEVYTHRQILNTIDDIYRTNELYEKQIKHLGKNTLSISLKREMLKEIKHNLKTLEKMKQYDEIYSKVLPLVEKIKIYEDAPETRETRKKLKHYKKEVIKLCGENFEYFPAYFVTEINEKLSRAPKKLRIIKKEKVANVPNKRHLIGEAIKSISQRISQRNSADDVKSSPIESLISLGKDIAQNGINRRILERLNNKKIDEAIDTFSSRHKSK